MLPVAKTTSSPVAREVVVSPRDLLGILSEVGDRVTVDKLEEVWAAVTAYWTGDWHTTRARDSASVVAAFMAYKSRIEEQRLDRRTPAESLRRMERKLARLADPARPRLDRDFADGLRYRIGTWIAPQVPIHLYPDDGTTMLAFGQIRDLRREVTPSLPGPGILEARGHRLLAMSPSEMPDDVAVCEGCTIVFERSRADARHCQLCGKREPVRASFLTRLPARGETVALRVPELEDGKWLDGLKRWRTVYVGRCSGCGEYFTATRKHARVCPGSKRCEQKHKLRRAA
jgi:hypothetical protein